MTRLPDWEQRLHDFISANRTRAFAWGEWDCALFAASAVEAMTGFDFGRPFRARGYTDARGAALALREVGAGTLLKTVDSHFARKPVGLAGRGDIVMAGTALGICDGPHAWFVGEEQLADMIGAPQFEGLIRLPRRCWAKAWGV